METEVYAYEEEGEPDVLTEFITSLKDRNDVKKVRKLVRFLQTQGRDLGHPISKPVGDAVLELRDMSCGFRLYYTFFNKEIAVLLIGGDKSSQDSDIERAKERRKRLIEK